MMSLPPPDNKIRVYMRASGGPIRATAEFPFSDFRPTLVGSPIQQIKDPLDGLPDNQRAATLLNLVVHYGKTIPT